MTTDPIDSTASNAQLERNITTAYVMRVLLCAWAHIPTLLLFYQAHGLKLSDVFLLKSALSVLVLLLEVPSGYFADRVGRSASLLWGGVVWLISMAVFIGGSSFTHFLIAELLLGAGISLVSGADSAFLFDTLKCLAREHEYKKLEGRMVSASGFSEAFFGILGAGLAAYDLVYPFYLQGALVILYIGAAFTLKEPPRTRLSASGVGIIELLRLCKTVLLNRPRLRLIMLFSGFSSTGTLSIVWFSQSYMKAIELPVATFGIVWAVLHCILAFGSLLAHVLDDAIGRARTYMLLAIVLSVAYIGLGCSESVYGLGFVGCLYVVRGVRTPLVRDHINSLTESDVRATVLSLQSFVFRVLYAGLSPLLGYCADLYSLQTALIITGFVLFIPTATAALLLARQPES